MKDYKGWTAAERAASDRDTKAAIKRGEIPPPTKCNRCGQDQGIIHYHNEDYSHPTKYLEALCWRCHMVLHSAHRAPEACEQYWKAIQEGKRFPPVIKHDFGILRKDHKIT